MNEFVGGEQETILHKLTPDDIRVLIEFVGEDSRRGNFERIFPTTNSRKYHRYFEQQRYYNLLLDAWCRKYARAELQGKCSVMLIEHEHTHKIDLLLGGIRAATMGPTSPNPKRHLDRFSRFSRATVVTNRYADTRTQTHTRTDHATRVTIVCIFYDLIS